MCNINHQALTKYSWTGHLPKVIASYLSHFVDMKTTLSMGYLCPMYLALVTCLKPKKSEFTFIFGQKLDQ